MPLHHLIDTFNQRFIEENKLDKAPFSFDGQQVSGHFGTLNFTSALKPLYQNTLNYPVRGHDTTPLVYRQASSTDATNLLYASEPTNIVCLDRLSRTVHMLNYLLTSHEEGELFLQVNPHHVLSIKKDHGAYFEEIIERCGLPVNRVVISLSLGKTFEHQAFILLDRLNNYRDRGYQIAVRFDDLAGLDLVENYGRHFVEKFRPDFVRFNIPFFQNVVQETLGLKRANQLVNTLRNNQIQIITAGVRHQEESSLLESLNPNIVGGSWYESAASNSDSNLIEPIEPSSAKKTLSR